MVVKWFTVGVGGGVEKMNPLERRTRGVIDLCPVSRIFRFSEKKVDDNPELFKSRQCPAIDRERRTNGAVPGGTPVPTGTKYFNLTVTRNPHLRPADAVLATAYARAAARVLKAGKSDTTPFSKNGPARWCCSGGRCA